MQNVVEFRHRCLLLPNKHSVGGVRLSLSSEVPVLRARILSVMLQCFKHFKLAVVHFFIAEKQIQKLKSVTEKKVGPVCATFQFVHVNHVGCPA